MDARFPLLKYFKSCLPGANSSRRNEIVEARTFFSDMPARNDGILFLGIANGSAVLLYKHNNYSCISMKNESAVPGTLFEFIRKIGGTPNGLFPHNSKPQIGGQY
jgi:hypothetical protein